MKISIIYHSETGNTREMANLVKAGCLLLTGIEAQCMSIDEVDETYVNESSAIVLDRQHTMVRVAGK